MEQINATGTGVPGPMGPASRATPGDSVRESMDAFRKMYLDGVPPMINDKSAFLSFVCCMTGLEALSGYRYPRVSRVRERLEQFVTDYFPETYAVVVPHIYGFRNKMIHAFNPGPLLITHAQSARHLTKGREEKVVLNAEDFFDSFKRSAERFFDEVGAGGDHRAAFAERLARAEGGAILVGPIDEQN